MSNLSFLSPGYGQDIMVFCSQNVINLFNSILFWVMLARSLSLRIDSSWLGCDWLYCASLVAYRNDDQTISVSSAFNLTCSSTSNFGHWYWWFCFALSKGDRKYVPIANLSVLFHSNFVNLNVFTRNKHTLPNFISSHREVIGILIMGKDPHFHALILGPIIARVMA